MLAGFINLGQNIVGKFMKINIGFSMECFTTDFLQLSSCLSQLSKLVLQLPDWEKLKTVNCFCKILLKCLKAFWICLWPLASFFGLRLNLYLKKTSMSKVVYQPNNLFLLHTNVLKGAFAHNYSFLQWDRLVTNFLMKRAGCSKLLRRDFF